MARKYYNLKEDAATIAYETILEGQSTGWAGDIEQVEKLNELLFTFNIKYVDDMSGTWKHVTSKPNKKCSHCRGTGYDSWKNEEEYTVCKICRGRGAL